MSRPNLRVLPGGRESVKPPAAGATNDRDRLRLAGQAIHAMSQHWQAVKVHDDGSITVTFDKRAVLAVRFLISWKATQ